jgi:hypothetical protein
MQQPEDEPVVLSSRNEEELRAKFRAEIHVSQVIFLSAFRDLMLKK